MDRDLKQAITATELKANLGKYLDQVIANNELLITKNGKKAARLSPYITDYDRYFMVQERSEAYRGHKIKISYQEFIDIYEKSELRMEFINGEIFILESPTVEHQEISGNLYMILRTFLQRKSCKVFYAPFDVHFFKKEFKDPDVIQPDLLIACDADKINEQDRYMGTPTLVIEILSPSTRRKDQIIKLNTYCLSDVKEYWIVDPKTRSVTTYQFLDNSIEKNNVFHNLAALSSYTFPDLIIAVEGIFPHK